jgi:hypothetical protein
VYQHTNDSRGRRAAIHVNSQTFARKLIDHRQHAEPVAMDILILHEIVGPDVIGIDRRQWYWALTALPLAFWSLHLQAGVRPQPMHALTMDGAFAPQQRPDAPIAVARMRLGKRRDWRCSSLFPQELLEGIDFEHAVGQQPFEPSVFHWRTLP